MEFDLCSLVSILTSDNPESSKKLEIIRKIEARPLGNEHQIDPGCEIESLARKTSFSHNDKIQTRRNLDPSITVASDDPRRGGRRGCLDMVDISSNTSNIRHTAGRKIESPDDDTIGLAVTPPKNSDTAISAHLKSMISEKKTKVKDFPVISPRPSTTAQKTKTSPKQRL